MKRLLLIAFLCCIPAFAQEHAEKAEDNLEIWKWANFVLLAGGLGYLAVKGLGAMFRAKSEEIRKGIEEANQAKHDAEKRAAEIDARVNALGVEVEKIRAQSGEEMHREGERIRQETAAAIEKIEHQAAFEVESAGLAARRELKEYAANLSLNLAEERIRARMDRSSEGALIDNFLDDLSHQASKGSMN